jgi:hypothetical protein
MRFRELKRTYGELIQPAWPPTVWASSGEVFTSGAQGVLKSVRRIRDHQRATGWPSPRSMTSASIMRHFAGTGRQA